MKSDGELQRDVIEALVRDSDERMRDVSVTARDGIVVLRGEVMTFGDRETVGRIANLVDGVTAVINEIVSTQDPIALGVDSVLAGEAFACLHALGPWADGIAVSVADQVATLTGTVDEPAQADAARDAVEAVPGVRAGVSLIRVAGRADARAVERRITFAFEAQGMPGADRVRVDVRGHLAHLSGTLDSVAERDEAVAAAEATPGITAVDDELRLQ